MENYLKWKQENVDRLIRLKEVLEIVPVSKSTWWSWCAQGIAPASIKLTGKTTCWRLSDIMAFIDKDQRSGGVQ